MKAETYNYSGLREFVDVLDAAPITPANVGSQDRWKNIEGAWAGGRGWTGTKQLWAEGWPEGIAKMRDALGRLDPPQVMDCRRRSRWSEEGDEFERDRLYTGHYDTPWRTTMRLRRVAPVPIRITVDVEAHAGSGPEALFWRGACAVLLAESLGMAGYPVEVIATSGADGMGMVGGKYRQFVTVTVKQFQEPMYLPSLIATTAHASFLRVGVFAHNVHFMPKRHTGGMGYSLGTDSKEALTELGLWTPEVRCVSVPRRVLSLEEAQAWVKNTVAALEDRAAA